jgi:hypothetical protein
MANILLGGLDKPTGLDSAFRGYQMGENIKQAPIRNQLLEQQVQGNELAMRTGEQNLLLGDQRLQANDQALTKDKAEFQLKDAATDAVQIKQLAQSDPMRAQVAIAQRIKKIQDRGGDPSDTIALREALTSGNIDQFNAELDSVINAGYQSGLIQPMAGAVAPKEIRAFQAKAAAAGLAEGSPEYQKAAMMELGMVPKAVGSAEQTIATTPGMTERVARSASTIKGAESRASEQSKSNVQLEMKPKIQAAVKDAEMKAKENGETFTSLDRAKAALPGIQEVADQLIELSDIATYTPMGKAWDASVKALGFGSTKGADARSQMTSIIDNQVLPLLRDTFGAAFTAAEGDRLRDALMNPDEAPDQKKARINAFMSQKMRDIQTKERQLGMPVTPVSDMQPQGASDINSLVDKYAD